MTIRPAPDFVIYDNRVQPNGALAALLESKLTNDGGTARDKASRFQRLRAEGTRLNVPVFGVLDGLGWRRASDALGPVVEATEGRVFSCRPSRTSRTSLR